MKKNRCARLASAVAAFIMLLSVCTVTSVVSASPASAGDGWVYSGWSDATGNDYTPQFASIDSGLASRTQSVTERYDHPFSVETKTSRHTGPKGASEWQFAIVCERPNGTTYSVLGPYSTSLTFGYPGCDWPDLQELPDLLVHAKVRVRARTS